MILVIERNALGTAEPIRERGHECSLQQTLRRMGFYAAREPVHERRTVPATAPTDADAPSAASGRRDA